MSKVVSIRLSDEQVADLLGVRLDEIQAALRYAGAYADEVEAAIAENEAMDEEALRRLIPNLEVFVATDEATVVNEASA